MRRSFALVLSVLTVLTAGSDGARTETTGNDFGWSAEVDAALTVFENGDAQAAVQQLTPLADAGDAYAQFLLGRFYEGKLGIEEDFCLSLQRHKEAAAQEHAVAVASIGVIHALGHCTQNDEDEAYRYFTRAAKLGHGESAFLLSLRYFFVGSNLTVEWMERTWSLKQQSKFRNSLIYIPAVLAGWIFESGEHVPIDLAKSERYFRSSASQGSPSGQLALGEFYLNHPARPRHSEAWKWIFLSAYQGESSAKKMIDDVLSTLTADEKVKAQDGAHQAFDRMVTDPRLELGRAALWCFENEPEPKECLPRAYEQHFRCSPGIDPTYFETRYVKSLAYRGCRKAAFNAQSLASD